MGVDISIDDLDFIFYTPDIDLVERAGFSSVNYVWN
jgi:hypothetical protein